MQRAPSILSYHYDEKKSLTVQWDIDKFFDSSVLPDDVDIEINNFLYKKNLGGSARSIEIPADKLSVFRGNEIQFTVAFVWVGNPGNVQRATVGILLLNGVGQSVDHKVKTPQAKIESVEPTTLKNVNRITVSWSGYSYTDGKITWGQVGQVNREHSFRPGKNGAQPDYAGRFSTSGALPPGELFEFRVQVRNTLTGQDFSPPATVFACSVRNTNSARQFLKASGVSPKGSLRQYFHSTNSLRTLMGLR
jgi:hypothetical protein